MGGKPDQKKIFYSSIYHAMLMPVDRTGENPLWQSTEPSYDDFFTIWDTFRSSSPLLTLLAQDRQVQIIRALVDIYRHDHFLPDGRTGNSNGRTQGGSNADILIDDGYVKGLPGIDWIRAYEAVVHDAEVAPADQIKEGRGGSAGLRDQKVRPHHDRFQAGQEDPSFPLHRIQPLFFQRPSAPKQIPCSNTVLSSDQHRSSCPA
jgi:putative alpha-1,2-mannosidase